MRGSGEDNLLLFWMVRSMTLHIPQDGCHVGKIERVGGEGGEEMWRKRKRERWDSYKGWEEIRRRRKREGI